MKRYLAVAGVAWVAMLCNMARSGIVAPASVAFTDVTGQAGIKFVHNSGRAGQKYLPETLGSGAAWFDADGDGWPDLLLINSKDWTPRGRKSLPALYHNNHDGTFTNVTAGSGLDVEMYGLGVAIGDYDNDGRDDVYITALEGDHLFHNEGHGKFRDVTRSFRDRQCQLSAPARPGSITTATASWTCSSPTMCNGPPKGDIWCSLDGSTKSYCTPESYKGTSSKLYHNLGGGKFEDVSQKAGIGDPTSKSLGVAVLDYNGDGWPDLFVTNDTQPNKLYRNNRNGTFTDEAVAAGVAFGEDGVARGAMGVDAADYDRSGRAGSAGGQLLQPDAGSLSQRRHGSVCRRSAFFDRGPRQPADPDFRRVLLRLRPGWLPRYLRGQRPHRRGDRPRAAEGAVQGAAAAVPQPGRAGPTAVRERDGAHGRGLQPPVVARGAAYADFDHDGDLDIVMTTNDGPAYLFRNDGGNRNNWISVRLVGRKSNRDGIGAVVRVLSKSGKQWNMVRSGSSYCSQSDLALTFGLGRDPAVEGIEIDWPSGEKQKLGGVPVNQFLTIDETAGIVAKTGPGRF